MSDLLEDRYRLLEDPDGHGGLVRAHDILLEQDVDLVMLDPVAEPLERARMMRRLRRTLRSGTAHVADVQDTGATGEQPFLVLSAESSPEVRWGTTFAPPVAARIVLDVLAAVTSLRAAGLSWFSLRQEDLRVDDLGRAQVIPLPGAAEASEDEPEVLASLGLLLSDLLPEPPEPLRLIAARATGLSSPPLNAAQELADLLAPYAAPQVPTATAPADTVPPTPAAPAPAAKVSEQRPLRPVPPLAVAPAAASGTAPADPPVVEPRFAPKTISLSSLLAHTPSSGDYVPLSSLLHDQDDPDYLPPARSGSKSRGIFHRRGSSGESTDTPE